MKLFKSKDRFSLDPDNDLRQYANVFWILCAIALVVLMLTAMRVLDL